MLWHSFIHSHNMDMSSYKAFLKNLFSVCVFSLDSLCLSLIAKRDSNPAWSVVKNKNKSTERVVVAGLTHTQTETVRQTHVRLQLLGSFSRLMCNLSPRNFHKFQRHLRLTKLPLSFSFNSLRRWLCIPSLWGQFQRVFN